MLVMTVTTPLGSVAQLGEVKVTRFSSLHRSRLSSPMSQLGEGTRAVMSRKEWFTDSLSRVSLSTFSTNIIELGEDPETVLSTRVSMQVTGSADCLSLVWLDR